MKNSYTLLRHAETIKDPNKPSVDWDLTPEALVKINEHINSGAFFNITKIISSTEPKSIATGKPISSFLNISISEMEEFAEVKREKKFLTDEEFKIQKQKELEERDLRVNGVESGNEATDRFLKGLEKLEEKYSGESILVITHGTIMTLFLAHYHKDFSNIYEKWEKLKFCDLVEIINY